MNNLDKINSGMYAWLTIFDYDEYGYMIPEQIVWITPAMSETNNGKEHTIYAVYYIGKKYNKDDSLDSNDYEKTWRIRPVVDF